MKKVIPSTVICHEQLTPEACFLRIELAKEKGYLIVESVDDPRYLEYMQWEKTNPPPQTPPPAYIQSTTNEVGLGSAFTLGILIVCVIAAFRYFLNKKKESEQEYEPVYSLNPWEDDSLFPSSDSWPDMRRVYPIDQGGGYSQDSRGGARGGSTQTGDGKQAGTRTGRGTPSPHTPSHPHFTTPPTPPSHHAVELAPALPNSILKILPFDPKEEVQLFEYESFRELFRYYPDIKRDDAILVIWSKKKGGNNPGYEAAKTRYQTFKGNMQAADNEWK